MENSTVKDVLKGIESRSEFTFYYNDKVINADKRVTVNAEDKNISEILALILPDCDFKIYNKNIIITEKKAEETKVTQEGKKITGVVLDAFGPVVGANIVEKGTMNGIISDSEGRFVLNVAPGATLIVSYIGYVSQEIKINDQASYTITLREDTETLEEVVVVGYGTMKKKDLTGAVKRVNLENSPAVSNTSLSQALVGSTAGVNTAQSGYAGEDVSLSIRGTNSFSASQNPLIVLDGIIYNGSMSDINVNDISSIDILKDASAAAVYGARSANGVILVTTKKGKTEKPTVSFNMSIGTQSASNYSASYMNAEEYTMRLADYAYQQDLHTWYQTNPTSDAGRPAYPDVSTREARAYYLRSQEEKDNYMLGTDIDWIDKVMRTGLTQDYNLGVGGSSKYVNYYLSGAYHDEEGLLLNDQFKRYTFNAKVDTKVTDWLKIGVNVNFSHRDYSGVSANFDYATKATPMATYDFDTPGYYRMEFANESAMKDPLQYLAIDNSDLRNTLFLTLTGRVDVPFIKGLSYDFNYSTTRYHRDNNTFYPADVDGGFINNGKAVKEPENENAYLFNHIFAYQREFGDHSLNATFVYTTEKRWGDKTTATAESFDTDNLGYNNLGIGTLFTLASTAWQESNVGLMGRINYNYKNRYLLTGTVRRDGYSGFGSNNKYVTLPSASIGWVISEEDFNPFEDTYLKLRLSYGQNGNQGISRYASLAKLGLGAYNYNDDKVISLYPSAMANKDLKWERTSSWNFGIDFGLFNQRLNGSFEVYKSKTSDVLVKRTLPNVTGYSWVWANLGGVENKGLEVELNSVNIQNSNFSWTSGFTFSLNRDKITELYGDGATQDLTNGWFVGESIGAIYSYEMTGVWQEEDLYSGEIYDGWYPGQQKFADLNGDGKIDAEHDRKIIGNKNPSCRFSFNNTLTWKNWSLYFMLNSMLGGGGYYMGGNGLLAPNNSSDYVIRLNQPSTREYWTPENRSNEGLALFRNQQIATDIYQNRGFVRLQDVSLMYTFDKKLLQKTGVIGQLQLFLTGKNLYTFTGWDGWDPEYTAFPLTRSLQFGIKLSL
nr:TonB-dependent receptor [Parabacteroides goldsteinii]